VISPHALRLLGGLLVVPVALLRAQRGRERERVGVLKSLDDADWL
jgi:hypothetical protein